MFCYKCGVKLRDNAIYCDTCGCETIYKTKNANINSGKNKFAVGVLCALFLGILGLFLGALLYEQDTKDRETFCNGWKKMFLINCLCSVLIFIILLANII